MELYRESTDLSLLQVLSLFFGLLALRKFFNCWIHTVSQQEALLHLLLLVCVVDKCYVAGNFLQYLLKPLNFIIYCRDCSINFPRTDTLRRKTPNKASYNLSRPGRIQPRAAQSAVCLSKIFTIQTLYTGTVSTCYRYRSVFFVKLRFFFFKLVFFSVFLPVKAIVLETFIILYLIFVHILFLLLLKMDILNPLTFDIMNYSSTF